MVVTVAQARANVISQVVDGSPNSITPPKLRTLLTDIIDAIIGSVPVSKLDATAAPTANDDISNTSGNGIFTVGSVWIDTAADIAYRCVDASTEAAVWVNTTLSTDDLGALAVLDAVNNETWDGTDLAIANGGTGASTAATARANLGISDLKPFVILAAGQSNMRGFGLSLTNDLSTDPLVYLWNTNATTSTAVVFGTQFNVGAFGTAPLNIGSESSYNPSLAFQTAKQVREKTGRPVYVVQFAAGGHGIESFITSATRTLWGWSVLSGDTDYGNVFASGAAAALAAVPGSPTHYDAFIWHQGEANIADGADEYAHKFYRMALNLEFVGAIDLTKTAIVGGELARSSGNGEWADRHYWGLKRASDLLPNMRIVNSSDIPITASGGLHFTADGIFQLGKRYADAIFAPAEYDDVTERDARISVNNGLRDFTLQTAADIETRVSIPITSTLFEYDETGSSFGPAYYGAENIGRLIYTRKLYRVPFKSAIGIEYDIEVDDAGGSVDHRAVVYQYDINKVPISAKVSTPASSPASGATGHIRVAQTFARPGIACDTELDATCEYVSYGYNVGVGSDDEAYWFRPVYAGPKAAIPTSSTTFTPSLQFGGAAVGMTYGTKTGRYQRHGNLIFFQINIVLTALGSSTGSATVTNLPAAAHASAITVLNLRLTSPGGTAPAQPFGEIAGSATTIGLFNDRSLGAAVAALTEANFTATSTLIIMGYYEAA